MSQEILCESWEVELAEPVPVVSPGQSDFPPGLVRIIFLVLHQMLLPDREVSLKGVQTDLNECSSNVSLMFPIKSIIICFPRYVLYEIMEKCANDGKGSFTVLLRTTFNNSKPIVPNIRQ